MRFFPGLALLPMLLTIVLTGCAGLDRETCAQGDWAVIGASDAQQGYGLDQLETHRKACERHGIPPDTAAYREGHAQGLMRFCTTEHGFSYGRNGYVYRDVCPQSREALFMGGYDAGFALHGVETEIAEVKSRLARLRSPTSTSRPASSSPSGAALSDTPQPDSRTGEAQRLQRDLEQLNRERSRMLVAADRYLKQVNPDL